MLRLLQLKRCLVREDFFSISTPQISLPIAFIHACPLVVTADVQSTTLPCIALPSNHAKGYRRLPSSAALIQHPPFALTEILPLSCGTGFIGTDGKSGIVTPKLPCTYYLIYYTRTRTHAHPRYIAYLLMASFTPFSAVLLATSGLGTHLASFRSLVLISCHTSPNEPVTSFSAANLMRAVYAQYQCLICWHKITTRFPDLLHK